MMTDQTKTKDRLRDKAQNEIEQVNLYFAVHKKPISLKLSSNAEHKKHWFSSSYTATGWTTVRANFGAFSKRKLKKLGRSTLKNKGWRVVMRIYSANWSTNTVAHGRNMLLSVYMALKLELEKRSNKILLININLRDIVTKILILNWNSNRD